MTSSSPEAPAHAGGFDTRGVTTVLRGDAAAGVPAARIDGDLRGVHRPTYSAREREALEREAAAARSEGYATGYAEGRRRAAEEAARQVAAQAASAATEQSRQRDALVRAVAALEASAAAYATRAEPSVDEITGVVAAAAYELLEVLLGRELALADNPGLDAVRRALAAVPGGQPVVVRLNPADHATVASLPEVTAAQSVRLVPDPAVEPGGCVADAGAVHVDACLSTALARVREVLGA